eukprot:842897-Rhodomonas_salina.5
MNGVSKTVPKLFDIALLPVNNQPLFEAVNVTSNMNSGQTTLIFAVNVTPGVSQRSSELSVWREMQSLRFNIVGVECEVDDGFGLTRECDEVVPLFRNDLRLEPQAFTAPNGSTYTRQVQTGIDGSPKLGVSVVGDRMVGTISFFPSADRSGRQRMRVSLEDSGEVSDRTGSDNLSEEQMFELRVRYVNQKPLLVVRTYACRPMILYRPYL